jgi:hypothetical protein
VVDGVIRFVRPEDCPVKNAVREMTPKPFGLDKNLRNVIAEAEGLEI